MKKTIFFAVAAMIMAAMVSVFVCVNNARNSMDELFNANVEALANNEGVNGKTCYNRITSDSSECAIYCGTCGELPGRGRDRSVCY